MPLLEALARDEVDFVLVGGVAGAAHGSSYPTDDLDIAYARDRANLERLAAALRDARRNAPRAHRPTSRSCSTRRRFVRAPISRSTRRFGSFDVLDRPDGAPPYAELVELAGASLLMAGVTRSRRVARSPDRHEGSITPPEDLLMATEYRQLSDELRAP